MLPCCILHCALRAARQIAPDGTDLQRAGPEFRGLLVADFQPALYAADVRRNDYANCRRPELYGALL